jgi:hypothetical protein
MKEEAAVLMLLAERSCQIAAVSDRALIILAAPDESFAHFSLTVEILLDKLLPSRKSIASTHERIMADRLVRGESVDAVFIRSESSRVKYDGRKINPTTVSPGRPTAVCSGAKLSL